MTIKNAESFFAWDVLSWLIMAMALAIIIVVVDLLLSKKKNQIDAVSYKKKSKIGSFFYFLVFLKFSKSEKYRHRPKVVQWSIELFPVLFLVLVFRGFIFEPFRVPSNSMMPTLLTGDFIIVNKFDYGLRLPITNTKIMELSSPNRGDVIVFRKPGDESIDYIKRLIGIPGDMVQIKKGILHINGKSANRVKTNVGMMKNIYGIEKVFTQYKENFEDTNIHQIIESSDTDPFDDTIEFKVPDDHFFFMGDNRDNSRDSRTSEVGFVPKRNLIGKAQIIFFSHNNSASFYEFWKWHKSIRFSRIGKAIE